jgi:hypothetical protein
VIRVLSRYLLVEAVLSVADGVSVVLARKSSRRQFFKFLSASSLGAGLWLTRSDVGLGVVTSCAGCSPICNPCWSPHVTCDNLNPPLPCPLCEDNGGCPPNCFNNGRVVLLPERNRLQATMLRVLLPERLLSLLPDPGATM